MGGARAAMPQPPPGKNGCSGTAPTKDQGGVTLDQGVTADQSQLKLDGPSPQKDTSGKDQPQGEAVATPDSGQQKSDTGGGCTKHSQCAANELCTIEGKCVKKGGCTKQSDCSEDQLCTIDGQCASRAKEDEGCSCQMGGTARGALPLLLLGVLLLARRRRRRWTLIQISAPK